MTSCVGLFAVVRVNLICSCQHHALKVHPKADAETKKSSAATTFTHRRLGLPYYIPIVYVRSWLCYSTEQDCLIIMHNRDASSISTFWLSLHFPTNHVCYSLMLSKTTFFPWLLSSFTEGATLFDRNLHAGADNAQSLVARFASWLSHKRRSTHSYVKYY